MKHPGVADCAVFGLPDDFWGERVAGLVHPARRRRRQHQGTQELCRQHLAGFETPKQFFIDNGCLATHTDRQGAEIPAGQQKFSR